MQYKIPQDVQREDKIVGPLSLRQMIICTIGFSLAYAIYTAVGQDYYWITALIPAIIIGLITVTFAFVKPLDLNFEKFILYWASFTFILPRRRYWLKGTGDPLRSEYNATPEVKKTTEVNTTLAPQEKRRRLEELSKVIEQNK